MRFAHDFYQDDPSTNDHYSFYHSQRKARAILEVTREIKSGLYEAKVIRIESMEDYRVMGQCGGCFHQYRIGDIFNLRKHKKARPSWSDFSNRFWFDPRFSGKDFCERFYVVEQ